MVRRSHVKNRREWRDWHVLRPSSGKWPIVLIVLKDGNCMRVGDVPWEDFKKVGRDQIIEELGIMMRNLDFSLCVLKTNQPTSQKTTIGFHKGRKRDYLISNKKKFILVAVQRWDWRKLKWKSWPTGGRSSDVGERLWCIKSEFWQ